MSLLRDYFFTGGMPESVKAFVETGSFIESGEVIQEIIQTFRMDFAKYAGRADRDCLREVWESAARMTGKQTKYSSLSEQYSHPTIRKAYDLLSDARLFSPVNSVNSRNLFWMQIPRLLYTPR